VAAMPILNSINGETIASFELSANEKYEVGFDSLAAGSLGTGVYLMGLAAEMLLKAAYFRCAGIAVNTPIGKGHLAAANNDAASLGVVAQPKQYHSLEFWKELLVKRRANDQRPLIAGVEASLNAATQKLNDNWEVGMRYQDVQGVQVSDLNDVFDAVTWLHENHESLWR
jgi:hypothetical protein